MIPGKLFDSSLFLLVYFAFQLTLTSSSLEIRIFSIFCVIPLLGLFFYIHEYNQPKSPFQAKRRIILHHPNGRHEIIERNIPMWEQVIRSIYLAYMGVLQMSYTAPVVTTGGRLNLIGFTVFVLTYLAVYTANLAAVLTGQQNSLAIQGLEGAIKASLRFCATRSTMNTVTALYGISESNFVLDPLDEGGDGLPGFNSPHLNPRTRVFDYIDIGKANGNDDDKSDSTSDDEDAVDKEEAKKYCHAAVAFRDDLDVLHAAGKHCNKSAVGEVLAHKEVGLPVFEGTTSQVVPLLHILKNNGFYERELMAARPESQCPNIDTSDGKTKPRLDIERLSGIWIVSASFSILALATKWFLVRRQKKKNQSTRVREQEVMHYDQNGEEVDLLEHPEEFLEGRFMVDPKSGRRYLSEPLDWRGDTKPKLRQTLTNKNKNESIRYSKSKGIEQQGKYYDVGATSFTAPTNVSTSEFQYSKMRQGDQPFFIELKKNNRGGSRSSSSASSSTGIENSLSSSISTKTALFDDLMGEEGSLPLLSLNTESMSASSSHRRRRKKKKSSGSRKEQHQQASRKLEIV